MSFLRFILLLDSTKKTFENINSDICELKIKWYIYAMSLFSLVLIKYFVVLLKEAVK